MTQNKHRGRRTDSGPDPDYPDFWPLPNCIYEHLFFDRLLIPADLHNRLHAINEAKQRAAQEQRELETLLKSDGKGDKSDKSGNSANKSPSAQKSGLGQGGKEKAQLSTGDKPVASLPAKQRHRVIDQAAIDRIGAPTSTDEGLKERNEKLHDQLKSLGEFRRIGIPKRFEQFEVLKETHPHFSAVIDFVGNRLKVARRSRTPQRIPPILLAGPPGIGKTHFCDALAKVLGVPCRRHQMDQAETSAALMGSEKVWSTSSIGLVFEEVVLGTHANPVIILDELDKASARTDRLSGPTNVLHSLLEPVTAGRVRDLSADVEFDASLVTWVATANYPQFIPATILSRMKCFWVSMPNAEEALKLVQTVARQAVADAGVRGFQQPERKLLAEIAHYSARQVYQIVSEVVARCVAQGRSRMELGDLRHWVVDEEKGKTPMRIH